MSTWVCFKCRKTSEHPSQARTGAERVCNQSDCQAVACVPIEQARDEGWLHTVSDVDNTERARILFIRRGQLPDFASLNASGLRDLGRALRRNPEWAAECMWGEHCSGIVSGGVAMALSLYADRRAEALECRERGDVAGALAHDNINAGVRERLPRWARW